MKKTLLVLTLCFGALFAGKTLNISIKETKELPTPTTGNIGEEIDKGIKAALSLWSVNEFIELTNAVCDDEFFQSIPEDQRKDTLTRYYAMTAASAVIIDEEMDVLSGKVEELKDSLEDKYDVDIEEVKGLSLDNEKRLDVARIIFLANVLAILPPKDFYLKYQEQFAQVGLESKHDSRALRTMFKFTSFLAIKKASALVESKKDKKKLESLSKKLFKSKVTTAKVADEINELFS